MESDEIEELIETVNKLTILLLSAQLDEYCTLLLKQLQELLSLKLSEKPQPSDINAKAIVQNQSLPLPSPGYQNLRSEVNDATEKSAAEQATSKDYGPNQGSSGDGPAKKTESLLIPKVSSQKSQPTVRSKRRTRQSVRDSSENAKTKQSRLATSTSLSSTVMGGELIPLSDIKVENPVPISADLIAVTVRLTSISESDTVVKSKRTKHSSVSSAPPAESKDCAEPAVQVIDTPESRILHKTFTIKIIRKLKSYHCKLCPYMTKRKHLIIEHASVHTGNKPYKCPFCDFRSPARLTVRYHIRTHTGLKPYKCEICDFRCIQKTSMKNHTLAHMNIRRHSCGLCSFKGVRKADLIIHNRIHTGEKPFKCNDCDFAACQLGSLLGHQRRHAGERPFRCEECSYRAGQLTHLQQHIRSMHSDVRTIPCPQCDMKFAKKLDLIRHKKAHSAKTYKFKCPKCEFRHDQQKRMAKHALIHQK